MACETHRSSMTDAALGVLDPAREGRFHAHLGECAACSEEFARAQALARAIDLGVDDSFRAEPSPALLARVRQQIAAEPTPPLRPFPAWVPVAAGALAALAAVGIWFRSHVPSAPTQSSPAPQIKAAAPPSPPISIEPAPSAVAGNRARSHLRRAGVETAAALETLPEVLVPPCEWRATMQFVAALHRDQNRAADIARTLEDSRKPLETADLKIISLEVPPLVVDQKTESKEDNH
jgi:hypothetical protein